MLGPCGQEREATRGCDPRLLRACVRSLRCGRHGLLGVWPSESTRGTASWPNQREPHRRLLRSVGFDRAALLPVGVAEWREAGHPVTDQTTEYPPATLASAPRPGALADKDEVLAATEDPNVRIIDVLPSESYQGLFAMYGRPGHIASAVNEPMGAISGDGFSLKSPEEIESGLGGLPDQRAITYCGGGIAAAASAFAMVRAGYTDVAIYPGSLEEWTKDPSLPMVEGPDPT